MAGEKWTKTAEALIAFADAAAQNDRVWSTFSNRTTGILLRIP